MLGSVPDCVILDGTKNADEGIQQEPYEADSKSNAAHHDPAVPDPPTSYLHCVTQQTAWIRSRKACQEKLSGACAVAADR